MITIYFNPHICLLFSSFFCPDDFPILTFSSSTLVDASSTLFRSVSSHIPQSLPPFSRVGTWMGLSVWFQVSSGWKTRFPQSSPFSIGGKVGPPEMGYPDTNVTTLSLHFWSRRPHSDRKQDVLWRPISPVSRRLRSPWSLGPSSIILYFLRRPILYTTGEWREKDG